MESDRRSGIILNVGRDPARLSTLHSVLQSAGYAVESTSSIEHALQRLRGGGFDLLVMSHALPRDVQVSLARCIRDSGTSIPLMLVASPPDQLPV